MWAIDTANFTQGFVKQSLPMRRGTSLVTTQSGELCAFFFVRSYLVCCAGGKSFVPTSTPTNMVMGNHFLNFYRVTHPEHFCIHRKPCAG